MTNKPLPYEPGVILHDAIIGAFRARGETLLGWCKAHGIDQRYVKTATTGLSCGPRAVELVEQLVEGAGAEAVHWNYKNRLKNHYETILDWEAA
ncbi:MAG: hypothetical protein ACWA40_07450 [Planktomarina sp.]